MNLSKCTLIAKWFNSFWGECVKTFALWMLLVLNFTHCWCIHDIIRNQGPRL